MTYDQGIIDCLEGIFSGIVVGAINPKNVGLTKKREIFKEVIPRFYSTFTDNIFYDEYAVLYEVIRSIKVKVFTLAQLQELLDRERDILFNSAYIDISKWSVMTQDRVMTKDEVFEAFWLDLRDLVIKLSNKVIEIEDFESACTYYKQWYIEKYSFETAQNMALIMSDGLVVRRPRGRSITYKGPLDMHKYYLERQTVINALSEDQGTRFSVIDAEWLGKEVKKREKREEDKLFKVGLKLIDDTFGDLRRSHLLSIVGPTKGGKTRFTNYLVSKALAKGLNVCVWPIEGTQEEWEANQISCMIRMESGIVINSKEIIDGGYEGNKELRQLIDIYKVKLSTDMRRGRLSFILGSAYNEDFIDIIQSHYDTKNPFDVIVIDQLVNILSRDGRRSKTERISDSYMRLVNYIKNQMPKKALALIPAQLKQVVIDQMLRNPEDTLEVTSAGESAEIVRSADEVIGLFSTREEKAANQMHLYCIASRHTENFEDFICGTQLGCCYFSDDSTVAMGDMKYSI